MAAESRLTARRATAALCWAAAAYVLLRAGAFYLHIGSSRRHHIEAASFVFMATLAALALLDRARRAADRERTPDEARVPGAWLTAAAAAGFVAISLLLYSPVLSTGLFADDFVILDAAASGRYTVWSDLFRPLVFVIWRTVAAVTSNTPFALHALNVVLHGVNGFLVSRLALRLALPQWAALGSGLLFLSFPASVEAVAWPSGIQDVFMTMCVLTATMVGTSAVSMAWRSAGSVAAMALGLMTKETAIAAPAVLALAGIVHRVRRTAWTTAAFCAAAVVLFLIVRFSLLPMPHRLGTAAPARYTAKELVVRPFATLVVPFRDEEIAEHPAFPLAAAALLVCSLGAAFTRGRGQFQPVVFAGAAMVLAAVAPLLTFFFIDSNLLGSRYLYLACAGWVLMLAAVARDATARAPVAAALLACWIALWAPFVRPHVRLWVAAAAERERVLSAAAQAAVRERCSAWAVYGLPAVVDGVPLFINGFPEAARPVFEGTIRVAPTEGVAGECRLSWTGSAFQRD